SGNLHLRVFSDNTLLSTLNGGAGFKAGQIRITNSLGKAQIIDLSNSSITSLGDVITKLNANGIGIKASVDSNGNGILLTDTAGGPIAAKVDEVNGGTTAASLNIGGSFTGTTLDGTYTKSVTILGTDTLNDIANKI